MDEMEPRYKRSFLYIDGKNSQEFVETAATATEALDREILWALRAGRVIQSITIELQ